MLQDKTLLGISRPIFQETKGNRFDSFGEGRWGLKAWKNSSNGVTTYLPIDSEG